MAGISRSWLPAIYSIDLRRPGPGPALWGLTTLVGPHHDKAAKIEFPHDVIHSMLTGSKYSHGLRIPGDLVRG